MSEFEPNYVEIREQFPAMEGCLRDQVLDAKDGFATPEQINDLSMKRIEVRSDYGQLRCEKSGCLASCVVRITDGQLTIGARDIELLASSCKRLTDIAPGR